MKINLYKLVVFTLKIIPMLMAFIALCDTILSYFYIDVPALSYIGGCSFLTLAFIYLASYAFRFCEYHRIFLHYIVVVNIINWYDYNYVIPINLRGMLCIQASLVVIFMFNNAKAFTYSNIEKHISIVGFNKHSDKYDYINSIVHEAEHIKQHMLKAYNVDDFGEAPAYTIGYLVMMMLKLNLFCC